MTNIAISTENTLEELINLIHQTGTQTLLTVNNPFLLDDPQKIWWVDSGNVSIYTVWLPEGVPSGKRYYFTSVDSGQIMMGFHSQNSSTGIGLLADAMEESILYSLDIEQFRSFLQNEKTLPWVAELVSNWIDNIFFGISENANHPNKPANVLIQAGERLILRQGDSISSQKNVVWAKIAANKMDSILINGKIKLNNEGQEILIPLTRRSFLESTRNVGMRFVETKEALIEAAGWLGLQKIDTVVLELERDEIQLMEEQAQILLQKKYETQFHKINSGLQQAESILNPRRTNKYAESIRIETEDMLFKAAQVVADMVAIALWGIVPKETDLLDDRVLLAQKGLATVNDQREVDDRRELADLAKGLQGIVLQVQGDAQLDRVAIVLAMPELHLELKGVQSRLQHAVGCEEQDPFLETLQDPQKAATGREGQPSAARAAVLECQVSGALVL